MVITECIYSGWEKGWRLDLVCFYGWWNPVEWGWEICRQPADPAASPCRKPMLVMKQLVLNALCLY